MKKDLKNLNMSILCLDLGTQTGFAFIDDNKKIRSGSVSFKLNSKLDRFTAYGERLLEFRDWLCKATERRALKAVYFESVVQHPKGAYAAQVYGQFLGEMATWCSIRGIPYEGVPVKTIKKHITGKGNASKDEVIHSILQRGLSPKDHNEADALALMFYKTDSIS